MTKGKPQPPKMYALKRDAADHDTACLVANLLFDDRAKLLFVAHGSFDSKKIAFANSLFSLTSGPLRDKGLHRKPVGSIGMVGFAKRLVKQFRDIWTAVGDGDGAEADAVEELEQEMLIVNRFGFPKAQTLITAERGTVPHLILDTSKRVLHANAITASWTSIRATTAGYPAWNAR